MARDIYSNTITLADPATGNLKALAGVQVFVYQPGTTTLATIYLARTGGATASNPLLTGATGAVEFFAEVGEYDVKFHDTNLPARIADKTFQWNATSGADLGTPSAKLARDAGFDLATLAADVLRQMIPIGTVIDWWRPQASVAIPTGFEICDGRSIAAAAHDFGTGNAIVLPDMRNKFIIGADPWSADGSGSTNGDSTAASGATHPNAPGIGGGGGSNTSKNFSHQHNVPGHGHAVRGWDSRFAGAAGGGAINMNPAKVQDWGFPWAGTTDSGVGAFTTLNGDTTFSTTGTNLSSTTDVRPLHIGLLRLMKVRRS